MSSCEQVPGGRGPATPARGRVGPTAVAGRDPGHREEGTYQKEDHLDPLRSRHPHADLPVTSEDLQPRQPCLWTMVPKFKQRKWLFLEMTRTS